MDQRMTALAKANAIRSENARVKTEIAQGKIEVSHALGLDSVQSMTVERLLICRPGWGQKKARAVLRMLRITGSRRVGELTHREKLALWKATV